MRGRIAAGVVGAAAAVAVAFATTGPAAGPSSASPPGTADLDRVAARAQDPPPASAPRYARALFDAEDWHDGDGNGCPEDVDVRIRDGRDLVRGKGSKRCPAVVGGDLVDPYTGARIDLRAAQVDHVAPLGYVYAHGAWRWTPERRRAFALDQRNLLLVSGSENMGKGDRPPRAGKGGYIPPRALLDDGEACDYARRWVVTLDREGLSVDGETVTWLRSGLARCRP